ncbi:MAG: NADPH:quinone reductase [Acidobacteria bacterium]|nr:NADPH:quinone reductase [Acidobacteriota bacterium]
MKAICVRETGGPEVLTLEEVPDPQTGAGEVLVRVHAAGVNPVDTYIRSGSQGRRPTLPYTPGTDGAGVIEAVGPGVDRRACGERVYFSGTACGGYSGAYAERAVCLAHQVHPLAASLSFAQGAAIGVPYATAHRALFSRAQSRAGETVLVHGGSGAVGIAAIQLARAHGMRVFATAGTARGLGLASAQGATQVFDHTSPSYLAEILAATRNQGVDVIIEMLANINLDNDLGLLALKGRVVVVGNRGRVEIDARQTMVKDGAVLGMTLGNVSASEMAQIHEELAAGLGDGTLTPVVGREFRLEQASDAHRAVMEPGAFGKIVLIS